VNALEAAVDRVLQVQVDSRKPLGIVLAGHNGSGKSTLWREHLSPKLQIPLVNADRMMLSILPEPSKRGQLVGWARALRDSDESWMRVAQKGVEAFVAQAMLNKVPFGMETVFSHWIERPDGTLESKIVLIEQMQFAGYFVVLLFVGLASSDLSIFRVQSRVATGGHDVPIEKLKARFGRTQRAIRAASAIADATLLVDNSAEKSRAFSVCHIRLRDEEIFDTRKTATPPPGIQAWFDIVSPIDIPF
jgi:predicted ABC-type ATPase